MPVGQQFSHFQQQTPQACVVDLVPPTGGAISSLTNNPDGSVKAQWPAASDANAPITYEVYVQKGTATGLFSTTPFLARGLSLDIYRDSLGAMIVQGETIFAAVRAVDALGNQNTNTTTLSVVATGLGYANLLSVLPGAVWDESRAAHVAAGSFGLGVADIKAKTDQLTFTGANVNAIAQVVADKTGYALTSGQVTAIAVAVEAALLNDGDGQALIAAIVASIGNQNIDQVLLIAAIRADLERVGGLIASRASQSSVNALELESDALSRVNALLAAIAAIPVVTPPTAGQIADAVWDEATAGHTTGGTFGLNAQTPAINAQQVADAVWDAPIVDHNDAGSFGANAQSPSINPSDVADAVWDALVTDHNDANSFGANAQNPPVDAQSIAEAVWDEPIGDHLTAGSTGKKLNDGLTAGNFIPAGQQIEIDIAPTQLEIEVSEPNQINIEIGDC
jgi:hypothetical protein